MIMSRYIYALTVLKSCSGHIYKFREASASKAVDQATTLIKDIMERVKNATIRIYKMWASEAVLLVDLVYLSKDLKEELALQSFSQVLQML